MRHITRRNALIASLWALVAVAVIMTWTMIQNDVNEQRGKDWLAGYQASLASNVGASSWDNACAETSLSWVCDVKSMTATAPGELIVETGLEDADSQDAWRYARTFADPDWTDNNPATGVVVVDRHGVEHFYSKRKLDQGYDG
ncbi:hypothetical protein QWJ06_06220 [Kocuria rhizophila]|uniref:hypothetical protein n=1 Tax=Kocuria rhizophila TaxID=72000 RepID=UPI0025AF368B|nr:hypothetical protein [Kocuria rhizophila]MDN3226313.1 hypothetical protein [Kocuria rhizophila]